MKRKLTLGEIKAFRALARAAAKLRRAQARAERAPSRREAVHATK
jgi:hypothetical protein